ncbi:MAG: AAA family ATPase, partial [Caldilineaceae bacterium]|nr:AAA family ATPase [Caldilineaceae bacterium]
HAPRQTGKTTTMLALARELTASGKFIAVMLSMQVGGAFRSEPGKAEDAILDAWQESARYDLPEEFWPPTWPDVSEGRRIGAALNAWAEAASRPLVIFLDEIDALQDNTLISVLHQLRDGYRNRPRGFPWSLALIGLRDVRDYKVASGGSTRLNTSSPFNIKVASLTLDNFTAVEVSTLYQQHTTETGQIFTQEALQRAFHLTQGQPWLVNALAKLSVEDLVPDPTQPVTVEQINHAKEILILRRDTHLDSLAERLREPRVRRVVEPILAGTALDDVLPDDIDFVLDLGLVRRGQGGGLVIANPIYKEVIPRELTVTAQNSMPAFQPSWLTADGQLDPPKLLDAFLAFWRQHGQPLLKTAHYHEIAPHIVLLAFLQRVVNGGGTIDREYAIGSRRMDLLVRYGDVRVALELKVWRDGARDPLTDGLTQLDSYLSGFGLDTGWLVIFDQRSDQPPIEERTTAEKTVTPAGRTITLIRA